MAVLLGFAAVFCAVSATAKPRTPATRERVVALQGTELQLAQSGRAVFADIIFTDPARAEAWLSQHVLQQEITFEPQGEDRYGRMLARSEAELAMLREGVAIAYSSLAVPEEFLQAEAAARKAQRGVWAAGALLVTPENVAKCMHQFALVEGTITHIYDGRSATYLNFGADWKTDFSVSIARRYHRSFKQLDALHEGSRVRVRGVVGQENGPMIELTHPEQLEIL